MTVYFIGDGCGHVKIGYTGDDDPTARMRGLQTGHPCQLSILAHCDGTPEDEKRIHAQLADYRLEGEWFKASEVVLSLAWFARETGTLKGFENAKSNPVEWADRMASKEEFKAQELSESVWKSLVQEAKARRRYEKASAVWTKAYAEWCDAAGPESDEDFVYHLPSDRSSGRYDWLLRKNFSVFETTRGGSRAVTLLAQHSSDPKTTAAAWIQCCIRDAQGRSYESWCALEDRVAGVKQLQDACHEVAPCGWHHLADSILPVPFMVPKRALLSLSEFITMCARQRDAIWGRYGIVREWAIGDYATIRSARAA